MINTSIFFEAKDQRTVITIILSKAYMRYWTFQISFVLEDSYNRRRRRERIVTIPVVREKVPRPDVERKVADVQYNGSLTTIRKVGLISKGKKGEGAWTDGRTTRQVHALRLMTSLTVA